VFSPVRTEYLDEEATGNKQQGTRTD